MTDRYFTPKGRLLRWITTAHRTMYRASGGRLGTKARGLPTLLLTTTGRRSGQLHTIPLPFLADSDVDAMIVVASYAANPKHPAWYLNLVDQPEVSVQYRGVSRAMRAETATGERRLALWTRLESEAPWYIEYQRRTDREIPVVILSPVQ
jgi:deazaflavin-dependent oxidoreductase (nitroreductase family)